MYKGTFDGDEDEVKFVRLFNSAKDNYGSYLKSFAQDFTNYWMVRVTTRQMSRLSGKKVFTRADCYLAEITDDIGELLVNDSLYLSEELLDQYGIKYTKIPYSGISIKMNSSESFQIIKASPDTFKALFDSYELGAGISLFCAKPEELSKNIDLIDGWKTTVEKMMVYYETIINGNELFYLDQDICKQIKKYASSITEKMITEDKELQLKIFNGVGVYDEPYSAHYFYHGDKIEELTTLPFYITTGSGRSHGDYTVVLKPIRSFSEILEKPLT